MTKRRSKCEPLKYVLRYQGRVQRCDPTSLLNVERVLAQHLVHHGIHGIDYHLLDGPPKVLVHVSLRTATCRCNLALGVDEYRLVELAAPPAGAAVHMALQDTFLVQAKLTENVGVQAVTVRRNYH